MAVLSVGDHINVAIVHVFDSVDEQINVFDLQVSTGAVAPQADITQDIIDMFSLVYATIEDDITDNLRCVELRYRNVTLGEPTRYAPWTGSYIGGTGSADSLPPQNAALVILRTETVNVQGKKYLPTFTEPSQANGVLTAGALADVQDFCDALFAVLTGPLTSADFLPGVYSRKLSDLKVVSSAQPRPQLAIQRDRRIGRGS